MRKILMILVMIFCIKTSAQSVEKTIILKDAETNLPIGDATVLILKTKQILLSNVEGEVKFQIKTNTNIRITHTAYMPMTFRLMVLKEPEIVLFLKPNIKELDNIIISKIHPQKILSLIVQNSIKKLTVPARLKIYSREFFKLNGTYSYYNDGLMNFQIFGRSKKFNSNILVEQNRFFGLIDADISQDLLGYNLNNIMENYYNFKYLSPLLTPKAKKEYDFVMKFYSKNEELISISATPIESAKGLLDDFEIIYDSNRRVIVEVSSSVSPSAVAKSKEKTAIGSKNIYKSLFKTIYKIDGEEYYLICSKEEIGFDKIDKTGSKSIEVRNYFVTTNFSNKNYTYKPNEVFKDKTLYNIDNVILTKYWENSGLTATNEEQEIINQLDEND